jgi:ketosteroid isomerase-like protein
MPDQNSNQQGGGILTEPARFSRTNQGELMSDQTRSKVDTVRAMFDSYLRQDRDLAERLLADVFVFTSPQDDHIDRAAFFERCFPTANRLVRQDMLHVVPTDDDDVFVMYEYELKTGERHRNVELLTVHGDHITEAQVFFGGRYDG